MGSVAALGARRAQLIVKSGRQVQQLQALLECVWPVALQTARQPFRSSTWIAALTVVVDRDGGDLAGTRRLGVARWESAVRKEIIRRGLAWTPSLDPPEEATALLCQVALAAGPRERQAPQTAAAAVEILATRPGSAAREALGELSSFVASKALLPGSRLR